MVSLYSEEQMAGVRQAFEQTVLDWPDVEQRKMFGCPAYRASETIFAILITGGLVLTRLTDEEQLTLGDAHPTRPFEANGRIMKKWVVIPISDSLLLEELQPFVEQSYQNALAEAS